MLRWRVLCVGKTEAGFVRDGVDHYLKRLRPLLNLEWEDVRPAGHSGRSRHQVLEAEGQALLKRVSPTDRLILLDEAGRTYSSPGLAEWMGRVQGGASSSAVLVLGGAFGVPESVKARADEKLSLSSMTYPHQLVRIMLVEQLYRAATIRAGQPYHHG